MREALESELGDAFQEYRTDSAGDARMGDGIALFGVLVIIAVCIGIHLGMIEHIQSCIPSTEPA